MHLFTHYFIYFLIWQSSGRARSSRIIQVVCMCPEVLCGYESCHQTRGFCIQQPPMVPRQAEALQHGYWIKSLETIWQQCLIMTELLPKYNFIDETLVKRPTKHKTKTLQWLQHELGIKHVFKKPSNKRQGQLWQSLFSGKLLGHRLVHVAGLGSYLCTDTISTFFSKSHVKYCRNNYNHCWCLHFKKES